MIEAFEIGVSLALDHGVADGIRMAKRDLATIEAAMDRNALSLRRLQEASGAVTSPARSGPATPRIGEGNVTRPQEAPRDAPDEAPRDRLVRAALAEGRTPPGITAPVVPRPTPPAVLTGPRVAPTVEEVGLTRDPPNEPTATGLATSVRIYGAAAMPGSCPASLPAAPAGIEAERVVREVPRGGVARPGGLGSPTRRPVITMLAAPSWSATHCLPQTNPPPIPSPDCNAASANDLPSWNGQPRTTFAAPVARADDAGDAEPAQVRQTVSEASHNGGTAAPPKAASETGPQEGDVFLDGMLVGRWMSRFLSAQAGRAPIGPTGFDSRRNGVRPGATVGMSW